MAYERFVKIANALNSTFVEEDSDTKLLVNEFTSTEKCLPTVVEEKTNVPAIIEDKKNVFEEQDYVKEKLHKTIDMLDDVMSVLKRDLRQGSKASEFEAFGNLAKSTISAITELRTYDSIIKHEDQYDENVSKDATNNVTINMNGADMLDRILEYRDKQVKTIPTDIYEA